MNATAKRTRRAVSLVELLVVMTGCTVILTTSAGLIHRVMRVQVQSRSFFNVERAAVRLSDQFREDVHRATAAAADPRADVFLRLDLPGDQTVEYRRAGASVLRTLLQGGTARARSQFAFTPTSVLEIHEHDGPRRLVLAVTSAPLDEPGDGSDPLAKYLDEPVNVRVEAAVGRDWRSAVPTADEEASP